MQQVGTSYFGATTLRMPRISPRITESGLDYLVVLLRLLNLEGERNWCPSAAGAVLGVIATCALLLRSSTFQSTSLTWNPLCVEGYMKGLAGGTPAHGHIYATRREARPLTPACQQVTSKMQLRQTSEGPGFALDALACLPLGLQKHCSMESRTMHDQPPA